MVLFRFDRGDHKKQVSSRALLLSPEDLEILANYGYNPPFVAAHEKSWRFEAGSVTRSSDEKEVIEQVLENLTELNRSLNFDVYTEETSALLSRVRGLKSSWEEYKGRLYFSCDAGALDLFTLNFYSSFFLPAILRVQEGRPSEETNTLLVIDYNGPLVRLSDGEFLLPPYQAYLLQGMEVNGDVMEIKLAYREELFGNPKHFNEAQIEWLQGRGSSVLEPSATVRQLNYHSICAHEELPARCFLITVITVICFVEEEHKKRKEKAQNKWMLLLRWLLLRTT